MRMLASLHVSHLVTQQLPMTTRRRAREIVVQMLYEDDLNPEQDREVADRFLVARLHGNRPLVSFARELLSSVISNREKIDKLVSSKAVNWSLRRMAAIDRNVLRLAAYEIVHTETPGRVVINEAIEIAKRYGAQNSGQFVNGILDRLLNDHEEETQVTEVLSDENSAKESSADEAVKTQAETSSVEPSGGLV